MIVAAFETSGFGEVHPLILVSARGQAYVDAFVEASNSKIFHNMEHNEIVLHTFDNEEEALEAYEDFLSSYEEPLYDYEDLDY